MISKKNRLIIVLAAILVIALSLTVILSEIPASNGVNVKLARIACLGDSITNSTGYPEDLQTFFGNNSVVGNFGVDGATVNLRSEKPYYYENTYRWDARNFLPTTVIFMLGTNDAKTNISDRIANFTVNYERLLNRTERWNSTKQIFLVIPPPIFDNTLDLNGTFFADEVIPRIYQTASNMSLPIIDAYTPLKDHPEYFPDGVHPNSYGANAVAKIIYDAIK